MIRAIHLTHPVNGRIRIALNEPVGVGFDGKVKQIKQESGDYFVIADAGYCLRIDPMHVVAQQYQTEQVAT
jgi:hypothetical protein